LRRKKNTDASDQNKKAVPNHPKKIKAVTVMKTLQILSRTNQNPPSPTIVDVTNDQPSNEKPATSVSSKETMEQSLEVILENPLKKTLNTEKEKKLLQTLFLKFQTFKQRNPLCLSIWGKR